MAAHAKTTGLAYDGKVKIVISHGLVAVPFLTTRPCLPRLPRTDEPAHGCLLQHATEVNYLGVVNTEAAGVMSAMRNCICSNLMCQACLDAMAADETPPHEQTIVWDRGGGFTLGRPGCAAVPGDPPGLWNFENIDACAAYLKSIFHAAERSGEARWASLWGNICRFHDFQCHSKWLKEHGLAVEAELLDLAHKAFCHLLDASSRDDLNRRLLVFWREVCPVLFPDAGDDDAADEYFEYMLDSAGVISDEPYEFECTSTAAKYMEYLLATRFAPRRHSAYLPGDHRARCHCQYGIVGSPEADYFNMNCESIIKVLFVDALERRAFPQVAPFIAYATALSLDGRPLPKSVPATVRIRKERAESDREARFSLTNRYEQGCMYVTIMLDGVMDSPHGDVKYVDHTKAWMQALTDDPAVLRTAWSPHERTRACLAHFEEFIDGYFDTLVPTVPAVPHCNRVLLTPNQKAERVGDGDKRFIQQRDSVNAKVPPILSLLNRSCFKYGDNRV